MNTWLFDQLFEEDLPCESSDYIYFKTQPSKVFSLIVKTLLASLVILSHAAFEAHEFLLVSIVLVKLISNTKHSCHERFSINEHLTMKTHDDQKHDHHHLIQHIFMFRYLVIFKLKSTDKLSLKGMYKDSNQMIFYDQLPEQSFTQLKILLRFGQHT